MQKCARNAEIWIKVENLWQTNQFWKKVDFQKMSTLFCQKCPRFKLANSRLFSCLEKVRRGRLENKNIYNHLIELVSRELKESLVKSYCKKIVGVISLVCILQQGLQHRTNFPKQTTNHTISQPSVTFSLLLLNQNQYETSMQAN